MERSLSPILKSVGLLACALLICQACVMASSRTPAGSDQDAGAGSGGVSGSGGKGGGAGGVIGSMGGGGGTSNGNCVGLQCQQTTCTGPGCMATACPAGQKTSLSGIVYDPAGKVPLYNVQVYVPNTALTPLPEGASCDRCETPVSGNPVYEHPTTHRNSGGNQPGGDVAQSGRA